jgi:hypothetical protein
MAEAEGLIGHANTVGMRLVTHGSERKTWLPALSAEFIAHEGDLARSQDSPGTIGVSQD